MIGLLLKDYYSLRTYMGKQMFILVFVYLVMAISMQSTIAFTPMIVMYVTMMLISSFSLDDATHWNSYALTLPLDARSIVGAKYVMMIGAMTVSAILGSVLSSLADILFFHSGLVEIWASAGIVVLLYAIMSSFSLPLFIKLGAEKARLWMMVLMMVPFFTFVFGAQLLEGKPMPNLAFLQNPVLLISTAVLLGAVIVYGSYCISIRLFESKEY